jgi:hypothetical protein
LGLWNPRHGSSGNLCGAGVFAAYSFGQPSPLPLFSAAIADTVAGVDKALGQAFDDLGAAGFGLAQFPLAGVCFQHEIVLPSGHSPTLLRASSNQGMVGVHFIVLGWKKDMVS